MITVFGSINIDLVVSVEHLPRPGETVTGPYYRVVSGGKGANQALAAARAGGRVRMIGCVGRDGFADLALADMAAAGIDLSGIVRGERPTGCAMIAVERSGQNQIIVASGANLAIRAHQLPDREISENEIIILQMEVPPAENWALVEHAKRRGARILLNCAPAGQVPSHVLKMLDWLIVNETEARQLCEALGRATGDPAVAGKSIANVAQTRVIVTLGKDGAVAFAGDDAWSVAALPITPVDTTAAGDAFVGAFVAAMERKLSMPSALRRASIAGGLACTIMGAQPSLPTGAAIEAQLGNLKPAARRDERGIS